MASIGKDYLACSAARRQGTCTNRLGVRRGALEDLILGALRTNLMRPDLVKAFAEAFIAEVNDHRRQHEALHHRREKDLAQIQRKLDGLIEAIANGLRSPGLQAKLDDLERRKAALEQEHAPISAPAPRLHPNLAELYRQKVAALQDAFKNPATREEAITLLRGLLERVTIAPRDQSLEIELVGDLARMIALPDPSGSAGMDRIVFERSVKVVAGPGFEPGTFRL